MNFSAKQFQTVYQGPRQVGLMKKNAKKSRDTASLIFQKHYSLQFNSIQLYFLQFLKHFLIFSDFTILQLKNSTFKTSKISMSILRTVLVGASFGSSKELKDKNLNYYYHYICNCIVIILHCILYSLIKSWHKVFFSLISRFFSRNAKDFVTFKNLNRLVFTVFEHPPPVHHPYHQLLNN